MRGPVISTGWRMPLSKIVVAIITLPLPERQSYTLAPRPVLSSET
jgi:hypothetical protein